MVLKTLKDFDWGFLNADKNGKIIIGEKTEYSEKAVKYLDLKQEAIKWLKEYYHPDKTTLPISAWLDFFNITEEDLK